MTLQLVAVDVIFIHGLLHAVAAPHADGANSVSALVLLQFLLGYEREALLAVTTHQRLPGNRNKRRQHIRSGNKIGSGLCFKVRISKIN